MESSPNNQNPALVLIDDDDIIRNLWAWEAKRSGETCLTYSCVGDFLSDGIEKSVPIYVDYSLTQSSQPDLLTHILDSGYTLLFITTGRSLQKYNVPPFIKGIVGKGFHNNAESPPKTFSRANQGSMAVDTILREEIDLLIHDVKTVSKLAMFLAENKSGPEDLRQEVVTGIKEKQLTIDDRINRIENFL